MVGIDKETLSFGNNTEKKVISEPQRCDGAKPACGQCVSKRRAEDCEYTTVQGLTRSQLLEENIAILESRIRELENPGESAPSIRLYDPHLSGSTSSMSEDTEGDQTPMASPLRLNLGGNVGAMGMRREICVFFFFFGVLLT